MKAYSNHTATATAYWVDDSLIRRDSRKKKKSSAFRALVRIFRTLSCCLGLVILAICIFDVFPFLLDRQPNVHLLSTPAIDVVFDMEGVVATQSITNELSELSTLDEPSPNKDVRKLPAQNNASDTLRYRNAENATANSDASRSIAQSNAFDTAWNLILVNKWNYVPDNYELEVTILANGQSVDKRIYPALQEMFDEARSNGVYPVVASGYRSSEVQQRLMNDKIAYYKAEGYSDERAIERTEARVAAAGTSEHQLGISVDINADGVRSTGEDVYEWLAHNSYKFGFIRRYPPDKTEITGIIDEPWHYRYVGEEVATEMYNKGICLEEYLAL